MKKKYFMTISILVTLSAVIVVLFRLTEAPSTIRVLPADDAWRKKIRYEKLNKLSDLQRRDIYRQVVQQMSISVAPDTAYHIIANRSGISVEDVKNIIGEGISSNWDAEEDSSGRNKTELRKAWF